MAHALCAEDASAGFAALGASTSAMLAALASAWAPQLGPGDVIIVSSAGHESNITPWVRCATQSGARLAWWHPAGEHGEDTCPLPALATLLAEAASRGERVRVSAFPHVSNLLGGVTDVKAIATAASAAGAATVCDGVAFAPHAAVDAPGWGLSFYAFSFYKTYGPHLAVLYGTHGAWTALREGRAMPNHAFITAAPPGATPAYAFELGGPSHEACAALAGLRPYLLALAADAAAGLLQPGDVARAQTLLGDAPRAVTADDDVAAERRCIRAAFAAMAALERGADGAATPLREFLEKAHADGRLRLLGPRSAAHRVPTFSFVPTAVTPAAVVAACHAAKVACRNGHMYAPRLLRRLGIATDAAGIGADGDADGAPPPPSAASGEAASAVGAAMGAACGGVVRVSAVHYNTRDEALRCIAAIDAALGRV